MKLIDSSWFFAHWCSDSLPLPYCWTIIQIFFPVCDLDERVVLIILIFHVIVYKSWLFLKESWRFRWSWSYFWLAMFAALVVYFDTLLIFICIAASWPKLKLIVSKIVTCFCNLFMLYFLIKIGRVIHIDMLAIFKIIDFVIRGHEDIFFCVYFLISALFPLLLENLSFVFNRKLEIAFLYIKGRTRVDGRKFLSKCGGWFFIDEDFWVFNFIAYQFGGMHFYIKFILDRCHWKR